MNGNKVRHSTYIEENALQKMKYISWYDRTPIQDAYNVAVSEFIKKFEKEHGTITDEHLQNAKISKRSK